MKCRYIIGFYEYVRITCFVIVGTVLLCAGCSTRQVYQREQDFKRRSAKLAYEKMVERIKKTKLENLVHIDFVKLRQLAFTSEQMDKSSDLEYENQIALALGQKNYTLLLQIYEKMLDEDYTYAKIHLGKALVYRLMGQEDQANFHTLVADGLIHSIFATGDGKTSQTAWKILSMREESALLNRLGYFIILGQRLIETEDNVYDMVKAQAPDGKTDIFYFDITQISRRDGRLP